MEKLRQEMDNRNEHIRALTAFAGVDPGVDESGQRKSKSNSASKVGSGRLRKTLFQVMTTLLQNAPENDIVSLIRSVPRASRTTFT